MWLDRLRTGAFLAVVVGSAVACAGPGTESPRSPGPAIPTQGAALLTDTVLSGLPSEARAGNGGGAPRPIAYWSVWNSCAPDNRAAEAAANGGPAAGFFLVDDLLSDPGIQLGDFRLDTCEQALAVLERPVGDPPVSQLAAELLAAELNLGVGAESCPVAEESVVGGHIVLSEAGFNAEGSSHADAARELVDAAPRLTELLDLYNRGDLCT